MEPQRRLIVSAAGDDRLQAARAWLREHPRDQPLVIVAASLDAGNQLLRQATRDRGAVFGWYRESLATLAGKLAAVPLAEQGLTAVSGFALQAVTARVVFEQRERAALGRFAAVAERPGLARALARTLAELGMAGIEPDASTLDPDLARLYARYREALRELGLADRAAVFAAATQSIAARTHAQAGGSDRNRVAHALLGLPTLLWDVRVETRRERELIAALADAAPRCLATAPSLDRRTIVELSHALQTNPSAPASAEQAQPSALQRLQRQLFEAPEQGGELGDEIAILSAPGESREAVEIARRVLREAARGVPFDRMAVLLRAPELYRSHLLEALRRARVPAYFSRGSVRPDPKGRALLALIACKAEGLSARRFAEYLSLGVVPKPSEDGAPPPAADRSERFAAPQDDVLARGDDPLARADSAENEDAPEASVPAPRRWERLLVDAAVLGGRARWERRLNGLQHQLQRALQDKDSEEPARTEAIERDLQALAALRAFALPLIAELDALPARARWGDWIDPLSALATRAIAQPAPVLAALAELAPMADIGPVGITEVQLVLERRLGDLLTRPQVHSEGRLFVGTIEEARGRVFDVVFVPGLAEKIFPPRLSEDPLLLDAVRRPLSEDLAVADDRLAAERSALQIAIGAARVRLIGSYPRFASETARPRVPSFYGLELLRAAEGRLPGFDELMRRATETSEARMGWPAPQEAADAIDASEFDLVVLQRFLRRDGPAGRGAAHYLLSVNAALGRALRMRARRWHRAWHPVDGLVQPNERAKQALLKHGLQARAYSATALERYAQCPYKFFLATIVGLSPRERLEPLEVLDPRTRGIVIHDALRAFLSELRDQARLPLAEEQLASARDQLDQVLDRLALHYHEELAPAIERVWEDGIADIRADLHEWLAHAVREPSWVPAHFELAFGLSRADSDPSSRKEPVALECGIQLRGSIDLVERRGGELRATDYKTGAAPNASDRPLIDGGKQLQPLLYALALRGLFPDARVQGGQAYYCTAQGGFRSVDVPLDEATERAARTVATTIGAAIDGGFLPAAPERGACERCQFLSVCGPYELARVTGKLDKRKLEPLLELRKER